MKQLSSAEFRKQYATLAEPVEVLTHGTVTATFIPAGVAFYFGTPDPDAVPASPPAPAPEPRMTIRPVKGEPKQMVGVETRLIDPIEKGRREREIYSQLAAKMYPSKGSTRR